MSAAMRELAAEAGIQPEDKLAFSKDGKDFHVWNIVYPDGKKYNIDVSQDALWENNSKNKEFFLVGDEHFVEYFNRDTDIYGKQKEDPTPRFGPNEPPYRSPAKGVFT